MRESFYSSYFEVEKTHWLMRVRRTVASDALERFVGRDPKTVKVLDFGCGSGHTVSYLDGLGYDAHGVDMSREAIEHGASRGIPNLQVSKDERIGAPDASFDAVLAMDVLEHLEDESFAVREIHRVLKPGGVFVVMVPAYEWLWGVQDEVAHHFRRYTKPRLVKAVTAAAGWKLERASYFNTFLFPPIAGVRLLSRLFGLKARESDFDINTAWMNKLFFAIFDAERKLLKRVRYPFGVSILAVFRKP